MMRDNETRYAGKHLVVKAPITIVCGIRKDGITVSIDGKKVVTYKGDNSHLTNAPTLTMPNRRALYVAAHDSAFTISKLALTPISGSGKVVR